MESFLAIQPISQPGPSPVRPSELALLVLPLLIVPSPMAGFFVFGGWKMLRAKQAPSYINGIGFVGNPVRASRVRRVVTALFVGFMAGLAHCTLYLLIEW